MSTRERIAITGMGAVCGAGLTLDAVWDAARSGRSALAPLTQWDTRRWPIRVACEVRADSRTLVADRKLHKIITRTDLFGLYAADQAVQQSRLLAHRDQLAPDEVAQFNDRVGVFAGSGGGTYQSNYEFFPLLTAARESSEAFGHELTSSVNPMWLLQHLPNNVLCHVGIRHGFKGTNACITNQCVSGAMAVAEAAAALRADEADQVVAVGHDAPIDPETLLHYHQLGLLDSETLRPFDRDRQGTVFGEGAAAVVLEKLSHAQARQANILGEYLGSGCATEGTGILDIRPDGDGVRRSFELALDDAGIAAADVGLIVAHGNGTRASDASEAAAIRRVFAHKPPPVTGFKWIYGHAMAASGTLDLLLGLTAMRQGFAPGIGSLKTLDPELAPFPVAATTQTPRSDIVAIICRGFGGMNVTLILRSIGGAPS
jgi:3-oxoacyl-[acyl-carrier-protein] synthase-1